MSSYNPNLESNHAETQTDNEEALNPKTADDEIAKQDPVITSEDEIRTDIESNQAATGEDDKPWIVRYIEVIKAYWMLGLIAFGGPQAHVAILRDHLVVQRDWMDEDAFMELFAIGQGLPGPTSTQLVVSTALAHAGPLAGITAFLFWNLPGFIVLTVCGVLISTFIDPTQPPWYLIGIPAAVSDFQNYVLNLSKHY